MLIGLAFFDLFFILCGVPVHITPIFNLENQLYAWLYAYFLYPFTAVSLTGSIYMTMAITIERYDNFCYLERKCIHDFFFMQVFGGLSTSLLPGCQHQNFTREESADVRYSGLHLCHHCQHPQVFGNHRKSNF